MSLPALLFASHIPDDPSGWQAEGLAETTSLPGPSSAAEQQVVARVQQGDAEVFRILYVEHFAVLRDVARSIVRIPELAEDIIQQVFIELWERRAAWHPVSVRGALIRAVRYRALDQWRAGKKLEALDAEIMHTLVSPSEQSAELHELETILQRAIARLPERRRTALLLRAIRNLSYAEIGHVLGVSEKAAFILVARARTALEPVRQQYRSLLDG